MPAEFECENCIGMMEHGCYCAAMGADGPGGMSEPFPGLAPCQHCFESSGYEARYIPATWYEPAWEDTDYSRPCTNCNGTGSVEMQDATDDELFDDFAEAFDALTATL